MSTGARVGGVQPPGIPRESWLRRKTIKSEAARRVREVTDNRTNEPSEAMILAALNAYSSKGLEIDGYDPVDEYPSLDMWGERFASQMRAALVAAQGAAPQAESAQPWNDPSDPNSPKFDSPWEKAASLIKSIRGAQWDMLERRDQADVRDEINGLIDRLDELATTMLAAPSPPSSGVDEIWRGRIVTASFENGVSRADCGLEDCECPEHEQPPRPAGTYVTIKLDKDERVGFTDVEIRVLAGKEKNND